MHAITTAQLMRITIYSVYIACVRDAALGRTAASWPVMTGGGGGTLVSSACVPRVRWRVPDACLARVNTYSARWLFDMPALLRLIDLNCVHAEQFDFFMWISTMCACVCVSVRV